MVEEVYMFLRKMKNKKTGRTYLSIVHSYRDKATKKTKSKTIESIGYLDDLEKQYDDPIAFFQEKVKLMNKLLKKDQAPITINISKEERIQPDSQNRKNLGYAALSKIYHELGIDNFLKNRQRHTKNDYDANSIMKLLVFAQLLYPASIQQTYDHKAIFFEKTDFTLDDVYHCLSFFHQHKDALLLWIHERIKEQYGRSTSVVYYYMTNNYFEKRASQEHRLDPFVLFMDTDGIPITYGLYTGYTLNPMLGNNFSLGKAIVVAGQNMITDDNLWYTHSIKNGYILSYSIHGANQKFKDYVLDQSGYRSMDHDSKIKSRLYPREITVTDKNGKKRKKTIYEKQVIFHSRKDDLKAKIDRTAEEKLKKEEELDGYYAIITSEYQESDERIVELYRSLWKIEESWKVTKSNIESRPIHLSKQEHIEAHFLIYFVTLVIARLLERRLKGKYSVSSILDSLRKASCSHIQENYYLFDHYDAVLEAIHTEMGIDLGKKVLSLGEIQKILGAVK